MTLAELRKELRKPKLNMRRLGFKRLGNGAYRTAYGNGQWVIKRNTEQDGNGTMGGKKQGRYNYVKGCKIPLAPTWVIGDWVVQRQYAAVNYPRGIPSHLYEGEYLKLYKLFMTCFNRGQDIYFTNVGKTKAGKVVAFDW